MTSPSAKRFLADAMLGRLARWLRAIDADTLQLPSETSDHVLALSLVQFAIVCRAGSGGLEARAAKFAWTAGSGAAVPDLRTDLLAWLPCTANGGCTRAGDAVGKRARANGRGRAYIRRVRRTVLVYGIIGGALIVVLKLVEYRYLVVEHSLELYGGIVAGLFSGLGIWLGLKLTRNTEVVKEVVVFRDAKPFVVDQGRLDALGITPREHEILTLIAAGLSNREIAEKLYVSENTVKTHSTRLFTKLNARRRTQAVQIAKEAGLIA